MQGLIGRKIGMTRIFDGESGRVIPVTIVHTGTNIVQQIKKADKDGYDAVQLGFDVCPEKRVNKAESGHFKKYNSEPTRVTREFKLDSSEEKVECGQKIGLEIFEKVRFIDVIGTSKGRGFTGTVKRYHFMLGRKTHGNTNRRARGSVGANTFPARVFPGLRMAGHHGDARVTTKHLRIMDLDKDNGLIYIKGAIPGKNKGIVFLRKSVSKL